MVIDNNVIYVQQKQDIMCFYSAFITTGFIFLF